jgi:hypothetical protein
VSQTPPSPPHSTPGSHYQPATSVMLVIVVLFVAAAFLMLRSNGPVSPSITTTTVATSTTSPGKTTTTQAHTPSRVRVQVANGTNTAHLASSFTQQLQTLGWDTLPALNATNHVAATVIYFNPGYLWAAQQIAKSIKVSASVVQPLNGLTPVAGANKDDVVVVLGPDVAIQG